MAAVDNKEVLDSDLLRAKMMELEYGEVTIEEVKRIYFLRNDRLQEIFRSPKDSRYKIASDDIVKWIYNATIEKNKSLLEKEVFRLRYLLFILTITSLLFTGGCTMSTPETAAFEDEFTREFMKSTKEVEDGYYLFESKTGGYTMWFPVNATMDEGYYSKLGDNIEYSGFGVRNESDNTFSYVQLIYENRGVTEWIDAKLSVLSNSIGYKGDYEEFKHNNKTYYYATDVDHVSDSATYYSFFSYVKSDDSDQGISFIYDVSCYDFDKDCEIDLEKEEKKALNLMKSIEFND
nr:hypothetical protein [Evansella caseinilytica]